MNKEIKQRIKEIKKKEKDLPEKVIRKVVDALDFALYRIDLYETDQILSAEVIE